MALQAAPEKAGGSPSDHSKTLDMDKFWAETTPYPKIPIEKWKRHFIVGLNAKTMIALGEIRRFYHEPELIYQPDEPVPKDKVETKAQEEQRTARNKERRQETKDAYDKDWD